ncbi:MAG: cytochrome c [Terracidiphilus sp.]|jgi:mono/diheme cytochrome c family protein
MRQQLKTAALVLLTMLIAGPAFAQTPGSDTYKAKCAVCHGADGLANTPMARIMWTRSFKAPEMIKASDAQLFDSTKNGKDTMKGYASKLTDAQIKEVVAYIRTLQK